jgi:Glyoxalase superfamily protein
MEDWEMVTINLSAAGTKKAASRLREFLASVGIGLKQTHAYEALAQALGYANWNTLQAQLHPPAMPKSEASPHATAPIESLPSASNADRIAMSSTTPSPGTEAWLRRYIDAMQRGQPNYDEMTPELAAANRAQLLRSGRLMQSLGALQWLTFRAKDPSRTERAGQLSLTTHSVDIFDAAFEKRRAEFIIGPLTAEGKVAFLSWRVLPTAEEEATIKQRIADGKPDPEGQDLLTRLIAGEQKGVTAEEIMSPELILAMKLRWPTRIQKSQRLGKFVSLRFLHVDMRGWDVYDATHENGHVIWRVGPLTIDHKLAGVLGR